MRRKTVFLAGVLTCLAGMVLAATERETVIRSTARLFGHPIHPMLVVFPLALFVTSLLFDVIGLWRRDDFWHRAAYYVMIVGFIGGVAAAIPGLIDYLTAIPEGGEIDEEATIHGILNGTVLVLFGLNLLARRRRQPGGRRQMLLVGLSGLGVVLVLVSAWLGGNLVYEHGVGVSPEKHERSQAGPGQDAPAPLLIGR